MRAGVLVSCIVYGVALAELGCATGEQLDAAASGGSAPIGGAGGDSSGGTANGGVANTGGFVGSGGGLGTGGVAGSGGTTGTGGLGTAGAAADSGSDAGLFDARAVPGDGCVPLTCTDVGNRCGTIDDDCGGDIDCTCSTGQTCNAGRCTAVTGGGFDYDPVNFEPAALDAPPTGQTVLNCGVSSFDSTTLAFDNWCGQAEPMPSVVPQSAGPDAVVLPVSSLTVAQGATLRLTGSRPVILAVFGNASVAGVIDADANGTTPGPGGNWSCSASQGQNGSGDPDRFDGASGGGGGGFQTAGGNGGRADTDGSNTDGGTGGTPRGTASQSPLLGGCGGGRAGGCNTDGGAGGGAVQISAAASLTVSGTIRANGGDGATPCGQNDEGGGTGGGSGGAILLEAAMIDAAGGTLRVNGGRGGANGNYAGIFNCGGTNGGAGSTSQTSPGANGSNCQGGSPGGGGGFGRITTNER